MKLGLTIFGSTFTCPGWVATCLEWVATCLGWMVRCLGWMVRCLGWVARCLGWVARCLEDLSTVISILSCRPTGEINESHFCEAKTTTKNAYHCREVLKTSSHHPGHVKVAPKIVMIVRQSSRMGKSCDNHRWSYQSCDNPQGWAKLVTILNKE